MKKLICVLLSSCIFLSGCAVNINGQDRQVAQIKANSEHFNEAKGTILATFENEDEKIIEVELENNERQAYYADQLRNFDDLGAGDEVEYYYDNMMSIVDLHIVSKAPDQDDLEDYGSERITPSSVNTNNLEEYDSLSLLSYEDIAIDGISIYTDAQVDFDDEDFEFDGDNRFVVVAYSENGDYKLFDEDDQVQPPSVDVYRQGSLLRLTISDRASEGATTKAYVFRTNAFDVQTLHEDNNVEFIGNI